MAARELSDVFRITCAGLADSMSGVRHGRPCSVAAVRYFAEEMKASNVTFALSDGREWTASRSALPTATLPYRLTVSGPLRVTRSSSTSSVAVTDEPHR